MSIFEQAKTHLWEMESDTTWDTLVMLSIGFDVVVLLFVIGLYGWLVR